MVKFLLIILIWIQLSDTEVLTSDSSNSTIDLTERFQVFDSKSRSFRKMQESEKSKSIIFKILKSEAAGSNLLLHSVGRNTLFMNRNPIAVFHDDLILDLDSLTESLQLNEFTFTIYNSAGLVKILMKATIDTQQPGSFSTQTTITERGKNVFTDFFVLAGFILLVFISVLVIRFPKDSADYSAIVNSLSFKNREETLITTRPLSRNNLLFIALNSLIIAFVLISFRILTPTNIQLTISGGSSTSNLGIHGDSNTNSEIYLTEGGALVGALIQYEGTANKLHILTSSGTGWSGKEKLTIERDTGNVGIGITNPSAKTHILQTLAADAFRVDDASPDVTPFIIDQNGVILFGEVI